MNQPIQLEIKRLGIHGEGIGHHDGCALFVDGALPGETITAEITQKKKTFGRAKLLSILTPAKNRVAPICPLFGTCGGCQLMHLRYSDQLLAKRQRVIDALNRIGKIDVEVKPCLPSPQELRYRNKIDLPFYQKNSHTPVDVETCHIHCPLGNEVHAWARPFGGSALMIRTAVHTGQVLLRWDRVPETLHPAIKGIVDPNYAPLWGDPWIEEKLFDLSIHLSADAFFQVNPYQTETLYGEVLAQAALTGTERVLDSYCGAGTLSLLLAQKAKQVTGIEIVPAAVKNARYNAHANGITNATFLCAPVEKAIPSLAPIDLAVVNPPRRGCDPDFLRTLTKKAPRKLIYISCDPATLARDLALLHTLDYKTTSIQPIDMFPQTAHVETVATLHCVSGS